MLHGASPHCRVRHASADSTVSERECASQHSLLAAGASPPCNAPCALRDREAPAGNSCKVRFRLGSIGFPPLSACNLCSARLGSARLGSARLGLRKPSCVSTSALALAGTSRTRLLRLSGAVRCALLSITDTPVGIQLAAVALTVRCSAYNSSDYTRVRMLACATCVFTLAPMRRTACAVLLCVLRRQQGQEALAAREGDGSKVGGTAH